MSLELPAKRQDEAPNTVAMPSPTAWPIVLAFGITLVFAGMVTTASVSILGAILAVSGYVGWFRDVLPHEKHESVPVLEEPPPVATSRPVVARVRLDHARSAPGTASPRDLSDLGGCEGRPGGKRCHGRSGNGVWTDRPAQHLVPDQSSGGRIFSGRRRLPRLNLPLFNRHF